MSPLVSIIIPCYNASKWIAEAVQSCLDQTYSNVEIIVVDDGSTDMSLHLLKRFGSKINLCPQKHRGGNAARNQGFRLSGGEFIQYLDADDYLLPGKIEKQIKRFRKHDCEVVYCDWFHKHERGGGNSCFEEGNASGAQQDILESLLKGWWAPVNAYLFRRKIVEDSGGWDESLKAAQDRGFVTSVALSGARFAYQPGNLAVYRRYGNKTVSTSNKRRWLDSHMCVLNKAEEGLKRKELFIPKYKEALAKSYFHLARNYYGIKPLVYEQLMKKVKFLSPDFKPRESIPYNLAQKIFGFETTERLALFKRKIFYPNSRIFGFSASKDDKT